MNYKALTNIGMLYTNNNSNKNSSGSLLIENDSIKEISFDPNEHFSLESDQIFDMNNNVVIPGFIDGHTHPIFAGSRAFEIDYKLQGLSYSQITEKGGGINYTTKLTRQATKEQLKKNLLSFCNNILTYGTTTVEVKTGYHLEPQGELMALEIIKEAQEETPVTLIPTFLGAHLVPDEFKGKSDDYVEQINSMIPEVKRQGIAKFTDVFCDKGAFTVDQTMDIIDTSIKNNIPVRLHGEEIIRTGIAKESAEKYTGKWISSIDHLLKATEEDFHVLAKNKVTATFMPIAPIVLFDPTWPDYMMLQKTNVSIGLGTDFNPNSWLYSMQLVLFMSTYLMHIPPIKALECATKNNALSLKLQDCGTLEIGNKADLLELNIKDISEIPYKIGFNTVNKIFKNGKFVSKNQ
jgi:imidazolonepropionase